MRQKTKLPALIAILAICSGCQRVPSPETAATGEEVPAAAPRTAPSAAEVQARQDYVHCLTWAAHYADSATTTASSLALVVAPLCYPQFSRLEAVTMAGLSRQRRRIFAHGADQLQMEMAANAVRQERAEAALSTSH
jgi:hypothetical protein